MRLAILLTAALLVGTFECAASCATANPDSACHHESKPSTACSHELVLDRIHSTAIHHAFDAYIARNPFPSDHESKTHAANRPSTTTRDPHDPPASPPLRL
jgi:hypothetical protein